MSTGNHSFRGVPTDSASGSVPTHLLDPTPLCEGPPFHMETGCNGIRRGRAILQRSALLCWAALVCGVSCADLGKYVWVENYVPPPASSQWASVIHPGDMLYVRVYKQEENSTHVRVRPDGKIPVPFLHDVQAAGLKPSDLATEIEDKLIEAKVLVYPVVTIVVEEPKQLSIPVVGEVGKQGVYSVEPGTGLLQILALCGGLTDLAHRDRIFVRRETPEPVRIRFTYDALTHGDGPAAQFRLQAGDTVVVE